MISVIVRRGLEHDHEDACAMTQAAQGGGNPYDFACTCVPRVWKDGPLKKVLSAHQVLRRAHAVLSKIDPEQRSIRHENVLLEIEEVLRGPEGPSDG